MVELLSQYDPEEAYRFVSNVIRANSKKSIDWFLNNKPRYVADRATGKLVDSNGNYISASGPNLTTEVYGCHLVDNVFADELCEEYSGKFGHYLSKENGFWTLLSPSGESMTYPAKVIAWIGETIYTMSDGKLKEIMSLTPIRNPREVNAKDVFQFPGLAYAERKVRYSSVNQ